MSMSHGPGVDLRQHASYSGNLVLLHYLQKLAWYCIYLLITSHHPRWTWEAMKKITGANTNYNYTNICIDL